MGTNASARRPGPRWALAAGAAVAVLWFVAGSPEQRTPEGRVVARRPVEVPDVDAKSQIFAEDVTVERARSVVASVPTPAPDSTLEVPVSRLLVRAVGPDGEPVPRVELEWVYRSIHIGENSLSIRAATGADGMADVSAETEMLEDHFAMDIRVAHITAIGVRCSLPFDELAPREDDTLPGVTWIEAKPPPGAIVEVAVPPYAFVRFTWDPLEHPRGGPLDALTFQVRRSDGDYFFDWRRETPVEAGASEFTFGPVGLDWEVWGELTARGVAGRIGDATSVGPRISLERAETPLVIAPEQRDLVAIYGRVVLPAKAATQFRRVSLSLGPHDANVWPYRIPLDEGSRFEIACVRSNVPRVITLRDDSAHTRFARSVVVAAPAENASVIDVGDVELMPVPYVSVVPPEVALVAGRVRDAAGRPIENARVWLIGRATRLGEQRFSSGGIHSLCSTRTDADGRFDLRASVKLKSDGVVLDVAASGYQPSPVRSLVVGATGIELRLVRGADARFRLRAPLQALVADKVSISLVAEGVRVGEAESDRTVEPESGARPMRFRGVPDGSHTFEVRVHGMDWEFHREEVIVAGTDVDLGLVDLTEALRVCSLTLLDAAGAPFTHSYVNLSAASPDGERSLGSERVWDDGQVTFLVPAGATDLRISHPAEGSAHVPPTAVMTSDAQGAVVRTKLMLGP